MKTREKEWIKLFIEKEAWWMHDENHQRPHVILASGKHSNGFFMAKLVTGDDSLRYLAADELVSKALELHPKIMDEVDCIVGPATGATKLAMSISEVPDLFGSRWASPEKYDSSGTKKMVFRETSVRQGERVLLCEDVTTTGGSVELTADAVKEKGGIILPYILTLVNRSGQSEINGRKVISLINKHMPIWDPVDCLLCKTGSEAIRPKVPIDNWKRLNATY